MIDCVERRGNSGDTDGCSNDGVSRKQAGGGRMRSTGTVVAMQRGNGHNPVTNSICRNKRTPTSTCRRRAYLPHCH